MRMMRRAPIVVACVALLAVPGQALALSLAPPGKAGANQYFETVPTSAGNAAPPQGGAGNGRALDQLGHGASASRRLSHLGKDGQAAAALAAATAPGVSGGAGQRRASASGGSSQVTISQPSGQSAASALANALTGSDTGGLGWVLPVLLVVTFLAAAGTAVLHLRRGTQSPDITA